MLGFDPVARSPVTTSQLQGVLELRCVLNFMKIHLAALTLRMVQLDKQGMDLVGGPRGFEGTSKRKFFANVSSSLLADPVSVTVFAS